MKTPALFLGLSILLTASAASLMADRWNQATEVTFTAPVEVPGRVLPAGTYVFRLMGSPGDRNIVEIYNANRTKLEELVLTASDERLHSTGKTVLQFEERAAGSPEALKAWFYPGAVYGQRFVYPHDRALQLAKSSHEPVYSTRTDLTPYQSGRLGSENGAAKMKQAPVEAVEPSGSETNP